MSDRLVQYSVDRGIARIALDSPRNRNALSAVSASLRNVHPVVLRPQVYWNIDTLSLGGEVARNH